MVYYQVRGSGSCILSETARESTMRQNSSSGTSIPVPRLADLVIRAGAIYSMAEDRTIFRAIAIREEWIVAVSEDPVLAPEEWPKTLAVPPASSIMASSAIMLFQKWIWILASRRDGIQIHFSSP